MSSKSPGQKRKQVIIQIVMLDDQEVPFQIDSKLTGKELINLVYQYLKLIESDYFGLEYIDSKSKKCWLDYDKSVSKQVPTNSKLIFCVKFYTPDPGQLEEEYTRYLYALQIKRDLAEGLLLCSDATASLLVSYILQAEIGDYVDSSNETNYLKERRFFPHQNEEHEAKIIEYHKNHIGQSPADADLNLLDIARKVELYGIIMHPAKDHEGVQLNLAVAHMGILVFQNYTKINTFSWAKIRKLSFRRKKFLVKLHPENYGFYKDTVEFYFDNRDDSKNFWKKCIENHSFFRCISTQRMPRQKSKLLTRGSSFRYYGRTQKELIENTRENFSKNRSFDRSYHSMRCISQIGGGSSSGGGSAGQINGTQSLNRNLASRSTGALVVPNGTSNLGSNDTGQTFHGYNQATSSSAHHLAYIPQDTQMQQQKTASLKNQTNSEKENIIKLMMEQQDDPTSVQSLNSQKQYFRAHLRDNDSSTHGSRTIDSRYSRDKTLGLSDEDAEVNNDDDDEDEEEEEEEEEDADDYDENVINDQNEKSKHFKKQDDKCTCKQHESPSDLDVLVQTKPNLIINQPSSQIHIQQQQKQSVPKTKNETNDNNSNYYTFKSSNLKPTQTNNYQQKLISLPIQQMKPSITSKLKTDQPTDNNETNAIVPMGSISTNMSTNPNKIYSRKEVITTYKEETKNTHLEEYHQTTTFYDTPTGSVEYLSSTSNQKPNSVSTSFKMMDPQASPSNYHDTSSSSKSIPNYAINGMSRSTPPILTSSQLKQTQQQTTSKYSKPKTTTTPLKLATPTNADDDALNNSKNDDDIDNEDEATKNDRCSLAARILYSNFQHVNEPFSTNNHFERMMRPSTLSKSLIMTKSEGFDTSSIESKQKPKLYDNINNNLLKVSINKYKQNFQENDLFPPPPPTIHQLEEQSNRLMGNYQPTILQDYQEPIKSSLKLHQSLVNTNIDSKNYSASNLILNIEDEFKRKKNPLIESYCIFKELVMTERTYKKDLDLLTQAFRQFATKNNVDLSEISLFDQLYPKTLDPINEFHTEYIKILEQRLFYWTDKNSSSSIELQKIGDVLLNLNKILKNYRIYLAKYEDIINELDMTCKKNKKFEQLYKEFESQKICYLPFSLFLLKPIQRLIHYKILIERLLIFYGIKHHDYQDTYAAFSKIEEINILINEKISSIENKQKLIELQRELIGIDHLTTKVPKFFVREGSLQKLSRKGYQQRMFFLFNDVLLYCARSSSPILQFKVHGEYLLKNMQIEDGNSHISIPNSFTIYSSNRSLLVSAMSADEKAKWLQDLCEMIEKVKIQTDEKQNYSSLKSNSSSDNNLDTSGLNHDDQNEQNESNEQVSTSVDFQSKQTPQQHRANTTMHVCWHRNTSVSYIDNHRSLVNQMSGYLLRKFKNSNGWQKLWVVFTNFCLFFYKTYQDDFPLASLPLLGYMITIPIESDNINKDYVFKLQFKNHVYFFRAESQYSFDRWVEVIESAANKQSLYIQNE